MKKLTAALCAVLLVFCMFVPGAAAAGPDVEEEYDQRQEQGEGRAGAGCQVQGGE